MSQSYGHTQQHTTAHTTAHNGSHNSNIAENFQTSRILKSRNKNVRCRDTLEEDVYYFFGPKEMVTGVLSDAL